MNMNLTNSCENDEKLMHSVASDNDVAFDMLYNRYGRRLCGFFIRMLACSVDEAKDYIQELFIRVYEYRRNYNGECFSSWLYSIAYNICKNELRHRNVRMRFEALYCKEESEEQPMLQDSEYLTRILHHIIDKLPQVQREVFILRYIEELPTSEVAQITGVPEGTVKSRLHYALATVKEKMSKYNL